MVGWKEAIAHSLGPGVGGPPCVGADRGHRGQGTRTAGGRPRADAAACGGGGDEREGEGEGSEVGGSATLLTAYTEPQDIEGIDNLIAAFNERYPDAEITLEGSPSFEVQSELLANSTEARFDASDLMPSEIGPDAFWSEGAAWVIGEQKLRRTLRAIDAAWPEGACGVSGVGSNC